MTWPQNIPSPVFMRMESQVFTISEYYDRDRPGFYRAIQSVRENGMDLSACNAQAGMTGWLEYFVEGLTAQLADLPAAALAAQAGVRERGELAIRRDVLIKEHGLSDRQAKALGHILEHGSLTIQEFEHLFPEVNRRSLQRDLKKMVDIGLLVTEGETHLLLYRQAEPG
jgi:hypothetical protein